MGKSTGKTPATSDPARALWEADRKLIREGKIVRISCKCGIWLGQPLHLRRPCDICKTVPERAGLCAECYG